MLRKLFLLYCGVAFFSFLLLNGYNIVIHGSTWEHTVQNDLFIILGQCVFFLAVLYVFARKRLKDANLQQVLAFPAEQFWLVIICAMLISAGYHIAEVYMVRVHPFNTLVVQHIMMELSLTLVIAMLLYAASVHILHSLARQLALEPSHSTNKLRLTTYISPLAVTYISLSIVSVFCLIWYMMNTAERFGTIPVITLIGISLFTLAIAFLIFYQLIGTFRRDLVTTMQQIISLPAQGRSKLFSRIPLTAPNEMGELVIAFRQMQEYLQRKHEQTEREVELASQVRNKLLTARSQQVGAYDIVLSFNETAVAEANPTMDRGQRVYDIQPLSDGRTAIMIGRIPGAALPATLVTASLLMLFRTETRKTYYHLNDLIHGLNRGTWSLLKGQIGVQVHIAVIDPQSDTVATSSTVVLGLDLDATFTSTEVAVTPDAPLILRATPESEDVITIHAIENEIEMLSTS